MDDLKITIRCLLNTEKNNCPVQELNKLFEKMEGNPIPYEEHGFNSLLELLLSIPDVLKVLQPDNPNSCLQVIPTKASRHILDLVRNQKGSAKGKAPVAVKNAKKRNPKVYWNDVCDNDDIILCPVFPVAESLKHAQKQHVQKPVIHNWMEMTTDQVYELINLIEKDVVLWPVNHCQKNAGTQPKVLLEARQSLMKNLSYEINDKFLTNIGNKLFHDYYEQLTTDWKDELHYMYQKRYVLNKLYGEYNCFNKKVLFNERVTDSNCCQFIKRIEQYPDLWPIISTPYSKSMKHQIYGIAYPEFWNQFSFPINANVLEALRMRIFQAYKQLTSNHGENYNFLYNYRKALKKIFDNEKPVGNKRQRKEYYQNENWYSDREIEYFQDQDIELREFSEYLYEKLKYMDTRSRRRLMNRIKFTIGITQSYPHHHQL